MFVANFVAFVAPVVGIEQRHVATDFALPAYSIPNALADERTLCLAFRGAALAASAPIQRCGYLAATLADSETGN
jgi:hypothetical protein